MFFNLKYTFHTKAVRNQITEDLLTSAMTDAGYSPSIIKTSFEHNDKYTITPKHELSLFYNSFYPDIKMSVTDEGDKALVHIKYVLTTAVSIILIVMLSFAFLLETTCLGAWILGFADFSIIMLMPLLIGLFGIGISLCGLYFYARRINKKLSDALRLTRGVD